jgi:hypothetical protein
MDNPAQRDTRSQVGVIVAAKPPQRLIVAGPVPAPWRKGWTVSGTPSLGDHRGFPALPSLRFVQGG